jgi:hypothetical protein
VLVNVQVVAEVKADRNAHFYWDGSIDFRYDCFVCRRKERTVRLRLGDEEGRCVTARKPDDLIPPGIHSFEDVSFVHPAPIRVSGFDVGQRRDADRDFHRVRCQLSYWWAPFDDAKNDKAATVLAPHPWVRLDYGLGCRACYQAGHEHAIGVPGRCSIQTNTLWPVETSCPTCERTLLRIETGPTVTLVQ